MQSDPLDPRYRLDLKKKESYYYTEFDSVAMCTVETGCNVNKTSEKETSALKDFYNDFGGKTWRFNYNWLEGDPCLNHWYGVFCNYNA